ncbi:NADP-dependent oxidoreductase [Streptomyces sp. GTA36]
MRAAVVRTFGGPEAVEIVDVDVPAPGPRQVRIKVAAAALNRSDALKRSGMFGEPGGLGSDVAGTVDAAGADTSWSAGDEVVALALANGTHAQYVVVEADAVAPAPSSADALHASTLPLNALTAAGALDLLGLRKGQSLLVTGAAGAVGGYAVQLATRQGVSVTALAREKDEQLVRSLGAAHVTNVTGGADFDAVLDAAILGEPALARVRDAGAYVGVAPGAGPAAARGVRIEAVMVRPDGARLAELVRLADEGVLTLRVAETYALEEAAKAHARLAKGGLRGRLVIVPDHG